MSTSANSQTAARTIDITPSSFASLPPTQNTSLQQPTAHQRFLNNPRHLKRLFTHTTLKSLLACQRVCKLWNQIITSSHACKEKLFLTSSPPRSLDCIHYYCQQQQQQPRLNPLLTQVNESISHLHPVYDSFLSESVNNNTLILTWKGSFYTPQIFFPRASNPSLGNVSVPADADADRQLGEEKEEIGIEFQLRRLSRFEVCFLSLRHYHHCQNYENHQHEVEKGGSKKKTSANNKKKDLDDLIFPGPEASLWNMYLCQPPPSSVNVTVWKAEEEYLEGDAEAGWSRQSGSTSGYVTERFMIHKAWTMREIFERMDEARSRARSKDEKVEDISSLMKRKRKGSVVKDLLLLRR
ncbi:uncharacterized protein SEPMUDRAFT_111645 [Sphaerulina musiva SO2202]|uniref:F-box domain-containing protein n=1 Tax=Sphaerulina musiva (strain SO2202) TaxID=692275 RepID=M3CX84_SPHMS|nr:uncharacterized protein SEPMUDRAFT_111645 [Sphaerulina musiva SO2202]EMF08281.1 hypothetical protein SEPMUDRAFT_111645 [Sphaerulina musiva SO2202]